MTLKKQFGQSAAESVKIRFSRADDLEKILQYYKDNGHQHVHVRDREWIARHVKKGQFLLVEKADGKLIASSATYDYDLAETPGPAPDYFELGSTNFNKEEGRGYDLYQFMIASQVVMAFLKYPPEQHFIANVYDSSPVGREMLTKIVGWKVVTPEPAVLKKFKETKSSEHTNDEPMTWYGATSSTLPHQARLVLDYMARGALTNKKTGKVLKLDLSDFPLANDLKAHVEELALHAFGKMLERSPDMPLEKTSAMLNNTMRFRNGGVWTPQPK